MADVFAISTHIKPWSLLQAVFNQNRTVSDCKCKRPSKNWDFSIHAFCVAKHIATKGWFSVSVGTLILVSKSTTALKMLKWLCHSRRLWQMSLQFIEARYLSGLLLRLFSLEAGTNAPKGRENQSNESQLTASSDGLSWSKLVSESRGRIQHSITSLYS